MNIAEKCFELDQISDHLFDVVNKILGCNTEKCFEHGFVWGAIDVFWDSYDCSVEIIRPFGPHMTKEQAQKIFDLGFGKIYESIGSGDDAVGFLWYRADEQPSSCSPREETSESLRLRAKIARLHQEIENLKTK